MLTLDALFCLCYYACHGKQFTNDHTVNTVAPARADTQNLLFARVKKKNIVSLATVAKQNRMQ